MSVIARDENQLSLVYSGQTRVGKHTYSYLQAIDKKIQAVNIDEVKVPGTQWVELAEELNCTVGDLIDKRVLKEVTDEENFDTDDWIKVLQNNPKLLTQPIAINGEKVAQIDNPTEILKFFGVDSAGIEKTFHTEDPDIPKAEE